VLVHGEDRGRGAAGDQDMDAVRRRMRFHPLLRVPHEGTHERRVVVAEVGRQHRLRLRAIGEALERRRIAEEDELRDELLVVGDAVRIGRIRRKRFVERLHEVRER
jgi:hypothetical protein